MHCLPYLTPTDAEITFEKLDKVAKTLNEKIKNFVKFFGIFLGWCMLNTIIGLFINRSHNLSLDTYRMISEWLRNLSDHDVSFILTFLFDNKFSCIVSLAILFAFGETFFASILTIDNDDVAESCANGYVKYAQTSARSDVYVVSYKQHVAFLA